MAQTNYTPISLYYSTTASAVPTAGNLVNGELAINITDGKLYFKNNSGVVTLLAGSGGGGPAAGSNTQVQFNNGGVFGASSSLTWDGTTLTTAKLSATNTTDSAGVGSGAIVTAGGLGVAKNGRFGGTNLSLENATPTLSVTATAAGTATLSLVSSTAYSWTITGNATKMSFLRDSTAYWYWDSTGIIPSSGSAFNLGASGTTLQNLYINYIKPVGGAAYTAGAFIDMYPSTNNYFLFHAGTASSDLNIGAAGSAAGGNIPESNAYQATFSNGPGFLFSTSATAGGKLLSLTGSGVGIGKNSASYALDIVPSDYTDGIYLKQYGSAGRAFQVTGDGVLTWGNGNVDNGQLTWDTGKAIIVARNALLLKTNAGAGAGIVNALSLDTEGSAIFAKNVSISSGGPYFFTGSLASKLWTPGLAIGTGTYAGLYGPALTYLANRVGSTWQSDGGGTAGALTIDEGYFSFARSQGVGSAGVALTWTTYLNSDASGNFFFNSTGVTKVASGNTAARPTATAGGLRWNTTIPQLEVGDGTNFQKIVTEAVVTATGGTVTTDGDYKVHTFTTSGTFTISAIAGAARASVQVLILGGGGGGGFYLGGGGGGGAMLEDFAYMTTGSYTVTVGGGGASVNSGYTYSGNGGASSITGGLIALYANGGGAGGNGAANDAWGANGNATQNIGCGGGGGSPYGFTISQGTVNAVLGGSAGWNGSGGACGTFYGGLTFTGGGGGGGAQSAGVAPNIGNGPVGAGGYGGSARPSSITGSSVSYAGGGGGGYGTYLANTTIAGGANGGSGVGSATSGGSLQATSGTANFGGGGGGGQVYSPYQQGGSGGSGVVIIRYKFQ